MEEKIIKSFICRVKKESCINKFLKEDIIYKLISCFNEKCNKKNYTKLIKDPLNIVLEFYRNYNDKYYHLNYSIYSFKNNLNIFGHYIFLNDKKRTISSSNKSLMVELTRFELVSDK